MTKKDLERRYNYLLLQIKIINEQTQDIVGFTEDDLFIKLAKIKCFSSSENIKNQLEFIESSNTSYNFFKKDMTVDEYI